MKKIIIPTIIAIVIFIGGFFLVDYLLKNEPVEVDITAGAYIEVVDALIESDSALATGKYMAVDLSEVLLEDKGYLYKLLEEYSKEHKYELVYGSYEGLADEGYIDKDNLFFIDGFLISFSDISLYNKDLHTKGTIWKSGTGAKGADYRVKYQNNKWDIKESNWWIS